MQALCEQLGANKHLDREKALDALKKKVAQGEDVSEANSFLIAMTQASDWESVYGGLVGMSVLLTSPHYSQELVDFLKAQAAELLRHSEFRVRIALAQALGSLTALEGLEVYSSIKAALFARIVESFTPGLIESDDNLLKEYVLKGGSGWQNLETAFKTLQEFMKHLPQGFDSQVDEQFWQALDGACSHPNRFVREIGQFLCGSLCEASSVAFLQSIAERVVHYIANGLTDNWSQVRYAASVSVRTLLHTLDIQTFETILVPRMCLNRYYVAEGVKKYSQETWLLYTHNEGKAVVARNARAVADFYISQCSADNHAVREAACLTIAELAAKVSELAADVIGEYAPKLLEGLIDCFKDESWPVRDAACLACAEFIGNFADSCKPRLGELKELWVAHLADNIGSVREHSAFALGKAASLYKGTDCDFIDELRLYIDEGLAKVYEEHEFEKSHKQPEPHNQEMFSCGSLAPKLKRGGGCMDHGFSRERHPWEVANGCVFLLRELGTAAGDYVCSKFDALAEAARLENYSSSIYFKRDVWESLPGLARNVGKVAFKNSMEMILPQLVKDTVHENRTVSVPAEECIKELRKLIGPNIFRGRVELIDPSLLPFVDQVPAN